MSTEQKHTPEPWSAQREASLDYRPHYITGRNGDSRVAVAVMQGGGPRHAINVAEEGANAARIVSCVNACVGMDDPVIQVEGLKLSRITLETVSVQLDEILATLREIAGDGELSEHSCIASLESKARAALAKYGAAQ